MKKMVTVLLLMCVVFGSVLRVCGTQKNEHEQTLNNSIETLIHKMKRFETKKKEAEATSELVTNKLVPFYYSLLSAAASVGIVVAFGATDIKSARDVNGLILTAIIAGVGRFSLGYIAEKVSHLCFSRCMKNKVREQVAQQDQPKIDRLLNEINDKVASMPPNKRNEGMKYLEERLQNSDVTEKLSSLDNIERLQALKERLAYE